MTPYSELEILIVMYAVSAQRVNLDTCCSQVVVAAPAINVTVEVQGWLRIIQVGVNLFYTNIKLV